MPFSYVVLGKTIRKLRKSRKLSQEVLSGLAGIARSHLSMIENGTIHANIETLWRLSFALDILPSELFRIVEESMKNIEE